MAVGTYFVLEIVALYATFSLYGQWFEIQSTQRKVAERELTETGSREGVEQIHPYLGYVYRPRTASPARQTEDRLFAHEEVSDFGFPDDAPPVHRRSPDRVIVGILGGSVAEQFARDGFEHFKRELQKVPKFAGREVVPVRLAVRGYKQPQQLIAVSYLLSLGAEFDLIVNIDGFNEITLPTMENVPHHVFAGFPRSWQLRVTEASDPAVLQVIGRISYHKGERQEWAALFAESPLHHSPLANLIWNARDQLLQRSINADWKKLANLGDTELSYCASGPTQAFASDAEMYEFCAALWGRCSRQLSQLCAANEIGYYHFLQPNQYVPGSKPMGQEELSVAYSGAQGAEWRRHVEQGYPYLIRAGADLVKSGVQFTDLTGLFREHPEPIYRDSCCHVNDRGDELIAKEICRRIRKHLKGGCHRARRQTLAQRGSTVDVIPH